MFTKLKKAVTDIPELFVPQEATLAILPIMSDTIDVYKVAGLLERKGWNVFTSRNPSSMALCVGQQHLLVWQDWLEDLKQCVNTVRNNPNIQIKGEAAVYGAAKILPDNIIGEVMKSYCDLRVTVKACPEK